MTGTWRTGALPLRGGGAGTGAGRGWRRPGRGGRGALWTGREARASKKSLVQGHVMKAPCLSDLGEESGELEGSRPSSVGSRPASTQPSVLELGEARSRRSVYQAGQPYSLASASMSMSRLVYDWLQEIRSAVLLNKEEEDIDSNLSGTTSMIKARSAARGRAGIRKSCSCSWGQVKSSSLHSAHCILYTAHCPLKTAHCTLYTTH